MAVWQVREVVRKSLPPQVRDVVLQVLHPHDTPQDSQAARQRLLLVVPRGILELVAGLFGLRALAAGQVPSNQALVVAGLALAVLPG